MRMSRLALAALIVLAGCGKDVVSPSPSPSPVVNSCPQTAYLLNAPGFVDDFHVNEYVTVIAIPVNGQKVVDPVACPGNYEHLLTWAHFGTWCQDFGNILFNADDWQCYQSGFLQLTACQADNPKLCGVRRFNVLP